MTVLDPMYKKCMLEYHFPNIYEDACEIEIERIDNIYRDLIFDYENKFSNLRVMKDTTFALVQQKSFSDGYDKFISRKKVKLHT